MEILIKIVQFILCFSLLVLVHEFGHFFFAKLFKIRVEKFYLFFNPWFSLFKFKKGDTEYGIGWIPFGGYVSISGMIDETKGADNLASEPQDYEFRSKPAWQRLLVMTGGVIMNIITAIIIFIAMSYSQGSSYISNNDVTYGYKYTELAKEIGFKDGDKIISVEGEVFDNYLKMREAIIINNPKWIDVERDNSIIRIEMNEENIPRLLKDQIFFDIREIVHVDSIVDGSSFQKAGIQKGDSIISANGQPIMFIDQLVCVAQENKGKEIPFEIIRKSSPDKSIDTVMVEVSKEGITGVITDLRHTYKFYKITEKKYTFMESIPRGVVLTVDMCKSYINQMKLVFSPQTEAYKSVGSVISMGNFFPASWDWLRFWNITALFSVILAIMNILPIPALDGGHVLFLLVEVVSGRKPSDKFLERVQTVGFFFLIFIMILALWNDISKFIF